MAVLYDASKIYNRFYKKQHYDNLHRKYLLAKVKDPVNIAEAGVAEGGTTKILRECFPDASLYLFDLFNVTMRSKKDVEVDVHLLYENGLEDDDFQRMTSGETTMNYLRRDGYSDYILELKEQDNVHVFKGDVCETIEDVPNDILFDLVLVNVNAYRSTLHCLNFFFERLTNTGRMYLHNSDSLFFTKKALDDFVAAHPEANSRYIEHVEWDLITKW